MHPLLLYCFTEPLKPAVLLDSKGEERWKETKTERKEKKSRPAGRIGEEREEEREKKLLCLTRTDIYKPLRDFSA